MAEIDTQHDRTGRTHADLVLQGSSHISFSVREAEMVDMGSLLISGTIRFSMLA